MATATSVEQAPASSQRAVPAYRLPQTVTFGNVLDVLAAAAAGADAGERVYDLSACSHFDSSLLSMLLELARRADTADARWRFDGAPQGLLRLAELYGVDTLLFPAQAAVRP